ncbi:hypothetical protein C2845_PM02G01580 [Panicum miliaceum]|uniref:Uncharacterized protein n=1 Tax=Panicum miliaceum TaxID=4540 RepID=A0A3L6SD53_PANMI|nr:hypothetical protein C2845_PM02G01580 [Panicum miliaceum]
MDVLKRELQRKRQLLDADFGGRKILRRAEIEARELQRALRAKAAAATKPKAGAEAQRREGDGEDRED